MINKLTPIFLIITFFVALQFEANLCVKTGKMCSPEEMTQTIKKCTEAKASCHESSCTEASSDEASCPEANCSESSNPETGCPGVLDLNDISPCCPSSQEIVQPEPDPCNACCPKENKKSEKPESCPKSKKCATLCIIVHPLWFEPAQKFIPVIPQNVAYAEITKFHMPEIEFNKISENPYPPWGVHPSVSSSVLRI